MNAPLMIEESDGTVGVTVTRGYTQMPYWGNVGPPAYRPFSTTRTNVGKVYVRVFVQPEPGHRLPTPGRGPIYGQIPKFEETVAQGWVTRDAVSRAFAFLASVGHETFTPATPNDFHVPQRFLARTLEILGLPETFNIRGSYLPLRGHADADTLGAPLQMIDDGTVGDPHHVYFPPGASLLVQPSGPTNRVRVVLGGREIFYGPWPVLVGMNDPALVALLRRAWGTTVVVPQFPSHRLVYRVRTIAGLGQTPSAAECRQRDPQFSPCEANILAQVDFEIASQGLPPSQKASRVLTLINQTCIPACEAILRGQGLPRCDSTASVRRAQQILGVDVDGIWGPDTQAAFDAYEQQGDLRADVDCAGDFPGAVPGGGGGGRRPTTSGGGGGALGIAAIVAAIAAGLYFSS